MKNRPISTWIFLAILIIFIGCSANKKNETITNQQNSTDVDILTDLEYQDNNDHISDIYGIGHSNITDFFFDEIYGWK
jgi:hypothetical protein